MNKGLIYSLYILLFWILLPAVLISGSLLIDHSNLILPHPGKWVRITGIILLSIAGPLLVTAVFQFHKYSKLLPVSATPPQSIIQKGLFAIWRHPIYLFFSLVLLGIAFILLSPGMIFISFQVYLIGTFIYACYEEKALKKRFGKAWEYHCSRTNILSPGLYGLLQLPGKLFLRSQFRIKVRGRENIPSSGPIFVVSSHRNYLDPFFIAYALKLKIHFVTTYEMFRKKKTAYIFNKLGSIPKKRHLNDFRAGKEIYRKIKQNAVIGIFPEGERNWTGILNKPKKECINLFRKYHYVPVLPVIIEGNYLAWPRWSKFFRKCQVRVQIGEILHIDPGWREELISAMIQERILPSDEGIRCMSKERAKGISKVIYRCPECMEFESLVERKNILHCTKCDLQLELDTDYLITGYPRIKSEPFPIHKMYLKIAIKDKDLNAVGSDNKIFFRSNPGTVSKEINGILREIHGCEINLFKNRLCLKYGNSEENIFLPDISSLTTENNYKLQLYDGASKQLYQFEYFDESVLKWQDLIVKAMEKFYNLKPNTS